MLDLTRIAQQGLRVPLSPIALAIQGLFVGGLSSDIPVVDVPRAAIVGRGPGTTVNYSDYLRAQHRRALAVTPVHTHAHPTRKRAIKRRQRREEEVILLLDL